MNGTNDFDGPPLSLYEYKPLDYHTCALFLCSSHWPLRNVNCLFSGKYYQFMDALNNILVAPQSQNRLPFERAPSH
jgi:hypothetical protein